MNRYLEESQSPLPSPPIAAPSSPRRTTRAGSHSTPKYGLSMSTFIGSIRKSTTQKNVKIVDNEEVNSDHRTGGRYRSMSISYSPFGKKRTPPDTAIIAAEKRPDSYFGFMYSSRPRLNTSEDQQLLSSLSVPSFQLPSETDVSCPDDSNHRSSPHEYPDMKRKVSKEAFSPHVHRESPPKTLASDSLDDDASFPIVESPSPSRSPSGKLNSRIVAFEALRKIRVYSGLDDAKAADIGLEWQLKASNKGVDVYATLVSNSSWQAIRSSTAMKVDKMKLLKLLNNEARIGDYDEMFSFGEVTTNTITFISLCLQVNFEGG